MISKYKLYSISNHLRRQNRSSDELEIAINALSLEELIALKLELSSKILKSKMYGFNLWKNIPAIIKDSMLKYTISATKSKKDASRYLGINLRTLNNLIKKYKLEEYFENKLDNIAD
jgi:DNA-binding NtrC family response regulator